MIMVQVEIRWEFIRLKNRNLEVMRAVLTRAKSLSRVKKKCYNRSVKMKKVQYSMSIHSKIAHLNSFYKLAIQPTMNKRKLKKRQLRTWYSCTPMNPQTKITRRAL